ncbi:MAG: trypsin-like peptidase domain-containing protein [Chloroflexi bacterium]|nr:trypsin-like peptidase domain-containing protein [Chloroflexota bacterium]
MGRTHWALLFIISISLGLMGMMYLLLRILETEAGEQLARQLIGRTATQATNAETASPKPLPSAAPDIVTISNILGNALVQVSARKGFLGLSSESGTGIIIKTAKNGYTVLTAAHVLTASSDYRVNRPDRAVGEGRVLNQLGNADLAALDVSFSPESTLSYIPVPTLRYDNEVGASWQGLRVFTRCFFDDKTLVREGKVVSYGNAQQAILQGIEAKGIWLGTTITSEPGCGGAPLLNATGELIAIVIRGGGSGAIAVAIPKLVVP